MNNRKTPWHSPPEVWDKLRPYAREMRRQPTPEEELVWERLRGRRFHGLRFRRQHAIGPFIVDFYCSTGRLVLEVDGGIHETLVEEDAAGLPAPDVLTQEIAKDPPGGLEQFEEIGAALKPTER